MRRIILSLCLLLMLCNSAYAFSGGTGTAADPYQISSVTELQDMNTALSAYYVLVNDIDASATSTWNSGEGWRPIGNFTAPFTGTFDGSGYTIDGLYINNVESNQGLFGFVRGGHIHDVGVTNASISGHTQSGILLGSGTSGTKIRKVHVSGTVTGLTTAFSIGGIAGRLEDSTISDSNGYTTVHVPAYNGGGLVGVGYSLVMQRCYAVSTITGSNIGGLVGDVGGTSTATSSYYDIDVSGVASNGFGEPKTTAQMQTQSTFTGWDFYDTWRMSGYPMLYSQLSDDFYLYPGDDAISRTAPPLLHSVTLDMFRKGAVSYDILIATDDLYTNAAYSSNQLSSGTLANYSIPVSLEARTYYMQVEALDSSGNTLDTATSTFTISQTIDLESTSVAGNIYEIISGVNTPISNVKVTLYNDTVSYDYITSSNGYYQFIGLTNSTTYNMVAVKNGYEDSTLNVFTSVNGSTVTKNILMQKEEAPNYITPHYVEFIVRSFNQKYQGVLVTVYEGNSASPLSTKYTGSNGAAGFELSETTTYRMTFYKESVINREVTISPVRNSYTVWVDINEIIDSMFNSADQQITNVNIGVTTTEINDTHAIISVSYDDAMGETTGLSFTLQQAIKNQPGNYSIIATTSPGDVAQANYNFTVSDYKGGSYIVSIEAQHGTFGSIAKQYGVTFEGDNSVFGFAVEILIWLVVVGIVWFASSASQADVYQTGFALCGLTAVFKIIGLTGSFISWTAIALALTICIVGILYEGEKEAV